MITLYRPVNYNELKLVKDSGWKRFPPRLEQQPIFYPVLNIEYAIDINKWNFSSYGDGFVLEFDIKKEYLDKFEIHNVGDKYHDEYWIPSEKLEEFNNNIIGIIRLV